MAVRRVVKKRPAVPALAETVKEYCLNRSMRERSEFHEKQMKAGLMDVLAQVGTPDGDQGQHLKLELDEPVEYTAYKGGKPVHQNVVAIQRQTRSGSMSLNEERVMAFLNTLQGDRKALYKECVTLVPVVNEDALLAANFSKTISDEEMESLYDKGEPTYAFQLITE